MLRAAAKSSNAGARDAAAAGNLTVDGRLKHSPTQENQQDEKQKVPGFGFGGGSGEGPGGPQAEHSPD